MSLSKCARRGSRSAWVALGVGRARRGSPDPAAWLTEGLLITRETFGPILVRGRETRAQRRETRAQRTSSVTSARSVFLKRDTEDADDTDCCGRLSEDSAANFGASATFGLRWMATVDSRPGLAGRCRSAFNFSTRNTEMVTS